MAEQHARISHVIDCGSVCQIFLETEDGLRVLAADGNMFRRAQEALGKTSLTGIRILYEETDWPGGIEWFSLAEDTADGVYCRNCRKLVLRHLNPDFCVFGRHPVKKMRPSNGAHADE